MNDFDFVPLFKNLTFLNLFASTLTFWGQIAFVQSSTQTIPVGDPVGIQVPNPQRSFNLEKISYFFFVSSFLCITLDLLYRWAVSKHPPLSNLYESLLFLSWCFEFLFIIFKESDKRSVLESARSTNDSNSSFSRSSGESMISYLGALISSTVLFLQNFADWQLSDEMRTVQPLIPALQSNWLLMHVSIMILSYASLFIGCMLAISYLIYDFCSNAGFLSSSTSIIESTMNEPSVENLSPKLFELMDFDSWSFRILSFGFPLLTLGILSGAVWANEAWGSYWSWDPKETWAFITWLIFAFYIHTRFQYGWVGKKSAFIASFGFFIVWVCYLGVNLLGQGLHSYGWVTN